jgi:DNA repair protein RecO (recombination protein O)
MPPVTTPALVLHVMPYGETSSIVRLLTRDLGIASALARGARRQKSRTAPHLDLFAAGSVTLIVKPHRELNTLTGFDLTRAHARLASDVERFAAASALAELALKCAPADPHPDVFDAASAGFDALEHAPSEGAGPVALLACWGLVVALGFAPALDRCVTCGAPVGGALAFSAAQGGALCTAHRSGMPTSSLGAADAAALASLISGRLPDPPLDARHEAAHRRLFIGFVRHHLAEHRDLPAMAFWDAESWNDTLS